jgi:hypothetical protein
LETKTEEEIKTDLNCPEIFQFTGSEHYYREIGGLVTDGVKYIMDCGYSWFVTDCLCVIAYKPKVRREPFLVIKLTLDQKNQHQATVTIDDGDGNILYRQRYGYTDAKRDLKLYFENGVLMLPSER